MTSFDQFFICVARELVKSGIGGSRLKGLAPSAHALLAFCTLGIV